MERPPRREDIIIKKQRGSGRQGKAEGGEGLGSLKKREPAGKGNQSAGLREKDIKKRVVRRAVSDISLNQRAEAANKNSEALFRLLFENSADGILLTYPDGEIYSANPKACRMFGRTEEEIKKLGRAGIVDTRDPRLPAALEEIRRTGKFHGELNLVKKDGVTFPGDVSTKIFKDSSGNDRTVMIIRDLTERKREEAALRENEVRFQELFNRMSSGVAVYEAIDNGGDFIFRSFNPAAEKIEKVSRKDILGKRVSEAFPGVKAFGVFEVFQRVWQTGKSEYFPENIYKDERDPGSWRESWVFKLPTGEIVAIYNDITDRKQAEEALRVSLGKYRVLFESFPLGITISDKSGKIIEGNRQSEKLLGIAREVHAQRRIDGEEWQIIRKDGTPMPADEYASTRALRENRLIENVEMGIVKDQGEITWISVTAAPIPLESYGVAIAYGDITERKRAEEALRKNEANMKALVENTKDRIWAVDADYRLIVCNPQFLQGVREELKREIVLGESVLMNSFPQATQDEWRSYYDRALRGETFSVEKEMQFSKEPGFLDYRFHPIRSAEGKISGVAVSGRDITERKRAEIEINRQRDRLQKVFDHIPMMITYFDEAGNIKMVNQELVRKLGWTSEEWEAENILAKSYPKPEALKGTLDFMNSKSSGWKDFKTTTKYGTAIDTTWTNISLPDGISIGIGQDITDRRQAEEALRKSESNLRALTMELSRVEESERQRLALFLHDEIGQSLALLRMMFGSLAGASKLKSEKHNIQQIRNLLEKVIDQTHTLTFELSPPVLHQLGLEAAIEWAGEKINLDHGIEFTFSDDGMLKPIDADHKAFLFRCVRELMMNIVKHAKARRMTVSLTRMEERVFIVVEDDGVGFDKSLLERPQDMPGFGLFSVREHLTAMGGSFHLQSEPGRGTCITLSVPLEEEKPSS